MRIIRSACTVVFCLFTNCVAIGGEFSVLMDRPTLVGINYGQKGVPGPFQGTWILAIHYPSDLHQHGTHVWSWNKNDDHNIAVDCSIKYSRNDGTTYEIKEDKEFTIDLANWSNGMYDEAERKDIVKKKVLLDYHKIPDPVCVDGHVPEGLSITKHVIGYREGEEVAIVVYQAKDMEMIRKFHRAPLFFRWGRDLDQSYHIEDNKKWLQMSQ